jgi:hypothetical protein
MDKIDSGVNKIGPSNFGLIFADGSPTFRLNPVQFMTSIVKLRSVAGRV